MATALDDRMRADLVVAMKARERATVGVLRSTLAAFANAEALPMATAPMEVVGRLVEHPRRELSDADLRQIVHDEIADREDTIERLAIGGGQDDAEAALRAEIDVLRLYL